jgi:hypothetical protein
MFFLRPKWFSFYLPITYTPFSTGIFNVKVSVPQANPQSLPRHNSFAVGLFKKIKAITILALSALTLAATSIFYYKLGFFSPRENFLQIVGIKPQRSGALLAYMGLIYSPILISLNLTLYAISELRAVIAESSIVES